MVAGERAAEVHDAAKDLDDVPPRTCSRNSRCRLRRSDRRRCGGDRSLGERGPRRRSGERWGVGGIAKEEDGGRAGRKGLGGREGDGRRRLRRPSRIERLSLCAFSSGLTGSREGLTSGNALARIEREVLELADVGRSLRSVGEPS